VCNLTLTSFPPNVALLVHKRTARGGRRGRGRMYIPWTLSTTSTGEGGVIAPASLTPMQTACNVWLSSISSGAGPVVLLHRPSTPGTARPSTPGSPNVVTSMVVDPLCATQRRRLGR
jgi:hypothetical protein